MFPKEFGRYQLLEKIGNGGMAEIFRATTNDPDGEKLVAIKRINPGLVHDSEFLTMFVDEANIAAQLDHPNICHIHELGEVDDQHYIALEHIFGRDLKSIFARLVELDITMPMAHACWIVAQMCEGLHYAHNCCDPEGKPLSLVHRDISLQNILISFDGRVKLIDFGIAKAAGRSTETQAGFVKGKFAYMSPEQLRGLPLDRRSDVFSGGIVLWELLCAQRLFLGSSTLETVRRVRDAIVPPASKYNDVVPPELQCILSRALAKHREDRYRSAAELGDALREFSEKAGLRSGQTLVGEWLTQLFSEEYQAERRKLSKYRRARTAAVSSRVPVAAATYSASRIPLPRLKNEAKQVVEAQEPDSGAPPDPHGTLVGWVPYCPAPDSPLAEGTGSEEWDAETAEAAETQLDFEDALTISRPPRAERRPRSGWATLLAAVGTLLVIAGAYLAVHTYAANAAASSEPARAEASQR